MRTSRKTLLILLALLVPPAVLLAACSGNDDSTGGRSVVLPQVDGATTGTIPPGGGPDGDIGDVGTTLDTNPDDTGAFTFETNP